jgi:SAM-dependent methyltransferase
MNVLHSHSISTPRSVPNTLDLEYVVCDYCGADRTRTLAQLQPPGELPFPMHRLGARALNLADARIEFVRCMQCGLVYMNPRLTEPSIARFYDTVYALAGAAKAFEDDQKQHAAHILDRASICLGARTAVPSMLDIGCGAGQVLAAAQARGWQVAGSELSQVAAERATTRLGIPIHVGDFRDMGLAPVSLDVVTILAVVEHLRAPVDFVRDGVALLKPGGVFVVEVPNVASLERIIATALGQTWRGFIIEHLYYFTPKWVIRLLGDLDLEIVEVSSRNPWTHLPNPLHDVNALLRQRDSDPPDNIESEGAAHLPPLPRVSMLRRIARQANNYALDTVSWLSDQGGVWGNSLFVWARKACQTA